MGNLSNLERTEAVVKLKELAEKARVCMFCTDLGTIPVNSRPMSLQEVDEEGNLWFISSEKSNKNFELHNDNRAQLFFSNTSDYEFLSVYGTAYIYKDKATIEDKWSPLANAWFDGKDDPAVSIIRISPEDVYYWDNKNGKVISLIKYVTAAITGNKHADGSVEGTLKV